MRCDAVRFGASGRASVRCGAVCCVALLWAAVRGGAVHAVQQRKSLWLGFWVTFSGPKMAPWRRVFYMTNHGTVIRGCSSQSLAMCASHLFQSNLSTAFRCFPVQISSHVHVNV